MFDIGWTEMLVVAIVAILFVGPKELPGMLRTIGRSVKKVRVLAGDFQRQFDDAIKDTELENVRDGINTVRDLDPTRKIKDKLNPLKMKLDEVKKDVEKATDYDPDTLFDESKAPDVDPPVEVDVDAALAKQRETDAAKANLPPSSGKNAVPGFGGPDGDTTEAKSTAKKAANAETKKTAAKKKPATPRRNVGKPAPRRDTAKTKAASKSATKKAKA